MGLTMTDPELIYRPAMGLTDLEHFRDCARRMGVVSQRLETWAKFEPVESRATRYDRLAKAIEGVRVQIQDVMEGLA